MGPQNYVTISRRPPDIEDYIDMLRRYRSWIVGPMFAGLVVGVVVAFLWPDTFESRAVMRITPQSIPEQLVPSAVSIQLNDRLNSLRTEILSRSNLAAVINNEKFNLYPKYRQRFTTEDAIQEMVKNTRITPLEQSGSSDRRFMTAFEIRFSYPDRFKAQAVVSELVSQFMNKNNVVQRNSATRTTEFLDTEVKQAKERTDALQGEMAKFQSENLGRLPSQAGYNGQRLTALQMRMSQANELVSRKQQEKATLETSLQNRVTMRNLVTQAPEDFSSPAQVVKNQNLINLDNRIHEYEAQLAAAREHYTDKHAIVRALDAQIAAFKRQRDAEQARMEQDESAAPKNEPRRGMTMQQQASLASIDADIANLKTQIRNVEQDIALVAKEKLDIEKQEQAVNAQIEGSPVVEQKFAQLQMDLSLAKQRYDELVRKQQVSDTSKSLEERGAGEQLDLLDPATLPQSPADPNRYAISGIGAAVGLMIGLVLAGAREAKDASLKNLKDVRAYTNLPVLSSIPLLENALLVRRKRRLFWLAWSTAVIIGTLAMSGSMYYYFSPHGQ